MKIDSGIREHKADELRQDLEELERVELSLRRMARRRPVAGSFFTNALAHVLTGAELVAQEGPERVGLARW